MKYLNRFILENKEFKNYCNEKISLINDYFIDLKDEYDLSIKHYWKEQFYITISQTDYDTWRVANWELKNESDLKSASIFYEKRYKILKKINNILATMDSELKAFEVKFVDNTVIISLDLKDVCPIFINNTGR